MDKAGAKEDLLPHTSLILSLSLSLSFSLARFLSLRAHLYMFLTLKSMPTVATKDWEKVSSQ